MNIFILNQEWFAKEYRAAGHNVLTCGIGAKFDVSLSAPLIHIDTILKDLAKGFSPDVILVLDNSAPVVVDGLAETDIPTVFYSVDAHHHWTFHRYLAQVFDYTFVAQKDYMPAFKELGSDPEWLPLWAPQYLEPQSTKEYGAVFVGTLNKKLNPNRVEFFERLEQRASILCKSGNYKEIFPTSEIVINQTVKGDLNFRVFEAMMCGAMLLTEKRGNGLRELFTHEEHLVLYPPNDVDEAAQLIEEYLADKPRARRIAEQGRAEILAKHTTQHRADRVLEVLQSVEKGSSPLKYFSWMVNFNILHSRLEGIDSVLSRSSLVNAMKAAEQGVQRGEKLTEDLAFYFVHCCCVYDQFVNSGAGEQLLRRVMGDYPELPLLKLASMRACLNRGDMEEAERLALELSAEEVSTTYSNAEEVIRSLLDREHYHDPNLTL